MNADPNSIKLPPDIEEALKARQKTQTEEEEWKIGPVLIRFCYLQLEDVTLGTRIRAALAFMVTPFTLILLGRSPWVTLHKKENRQ